MVRKVSQPAKGRKTSDAAPDKEPRVLSAPDDAAIWQRADVCGLKTTDLDRALTGRADASYHLARRHTAPRDGSNYARHPRAGHLIVWAECLRLPIADVLKLFGYDTSALHASVDVIGHTDATGALHVTPVERLLVSDPALAGDAACRVLAALPGLGLSANATIYWRRLDGVARYTSGRLCFVQRAPHDARRLAWVHDAPGPGAPCAYQYADGAVHRATLHACEPVRTVAHHIGAS